MRTLNRNKRSFYFAAYVESQEITRTDEYGNTLQTGEYQTIYSNPVKCEANISPANGMTATEIFGTVEGYDKILVMDDPDVPINEFSLLWVDTTPDIEIDDDNAPIMEFKSGGVVIGDNGHFKANDYIVKRVARSLNSVAIAARKVNVSEQERSEIRA